LKRFAEAEKLKVKDNLTQSIIGGSELIKPISEKPLEIEKDKKKSAFNSTLGNQRNMHESTHVSS
jgi:hypothetical protein